MLILLYTYLYIVTTWLAVVLPASGVWLHGWLLCSQLQVCGASWLAVVLPSPGG